MQLFHKRSKFSEELNKHFFAYLPSTDSSLYVLRLNNDHDPSDGDYSQIVWIHGYKDGQWRKLNDEVLPENYSHAFRKTSATFEQDSIVVLTDHFRHLTAQLVWSHGAFRFSSDLPKDFGQKEPDKWEKLITSEIKFEFGMVAKEYLTKSKANDSSILSMIKFPLSIWDKHVGMIPSETFDRTQLAGKLWQVLPFASEHVETDKIIAPWKYTLPEEFGLPNDQLIFYLSFEKYGGDETTSVYFNRFSENDIKIVAISNEILGD